MWLDHLAILDTDCNSHLLRHTTMCLHYVQGCKSRMSRQYLGLNDDEDFVTTKLQDVSFDGVTDRRLATRRRRRRREEATTIEKKNPLLSLLWLIIYTLSR